MNHTQITECVRILEELKTKLRNDGFTSMTVTEDAEGVRIVLKVDADEYVPFKDDIALTDELKVTVNEGGKRKRIL